MDTWLSVTPPVRVEVVSRRGGPGGPEVFAVHLEQVGSPGPSRTPGHVSTTSCVCDCQPVSGMEESQPASMLQQFLEILGSFIESRLKNRASLCL